MRSGRRQAVERIRPAAAPDRIRPALVLAMDLVIYAASQAALLWTVAWWVKPALAGVTGVAMARLFLIGHDACHGAFFPGRRRWNTLIGRLVFLPTLTPYSTWELGHNTLHHGFTNLKGKDYVYAPFSPAEYAALPRWRQWLERVYRHPLGPGLHYGIEVWWKRLWFPRPVERRIYWADSWLTLLFLAAQAAVVVAAARATGQDPLALAGWALVLPFVLWNGLMGFVTYQQHTHPRVVWYADREEWDPLRAPLRSSVHVEFPALASALLGNIMEHTAHHLDVAIPMFSLPEAQRRVEAVFPGEVVRVRWTAALYRECCRQCKLYDYARHQWTDFAGRPSRQAPARRQARNSR